MPYPPAVVCRVQPGWPRVAGTIPPMALLAEHSKTSRDEPYHFAGRREELAVLHGRLDDVIETGESLGGVALVTGVPGVGKTQLGRRFAKQAQARSDATVKRLAISTGMLSDGLSLFMAIGRALASEDVFRKAAETDTRTTATGGGIGMVKGNVTKEHVRHTGSFGSLLLATSTSEAWRGKALVLTVDELQGVKPAGMAALEELHLGLHGCPIMLLGIGLQHTLRVLESGVSQAGLSRPATHLRLGAMAVEDAEEAISGALQALGGEIPKQGAATLAQMSQGFPQHIHGYIKGACAAYDKHGGLTTAAAIDDAAAYGHRLRREHYQSRLAALGAANRSAMLNVAATMLGSGVDWLDWDDAVEAAAAKRENAEAVVEAAVERGVLAESEDGTVGFGMPSFLAYMEDQIKARERRLAEAAPGAG